MILEDFHRLSGLKISVSKSTAVWFGKNWDSPSRLCEDLEMKWSRRFKLLGITFDNNLEEMELNFESKILGIEKLLSNWAYRYLTPFGKVTIIKALALSKCSHMALAIPNSNKSMIKRLNTILYKK